MAENETHPQVYPWAKVRCHPGFVLVGVIWTSSARREGALPWPMASSSIFSGVSVASHLVMTHSPLHTACRSH